MHQTHGQDRGGHLNRLARGAAAAIIVLLLAASLLTIGVLMLRDRDNVEPDEDDWYVLVHGEVSAGGEFRIADLRSLGEVPVTMALVGTGEDGKEHEYTGVPLGTLISAALPDANATKVSVRAVDSYSKTFALDDGLDQGAYLVWEKDGKPIPPRSRAGDGPVRLIVSQERAGTYNAQHSVKWVSEVIIE